MGIIGGIIGGIGNAVSGIIGASAARKAAAENKRILKEQQDRATDWYDKEYNADYTQRSDAQAAINNARELLKDRYKAAEAAAVVGGGTEESIAAQKGIAADTVSDTMSNIAAQADAYKEQVRANYDNQINSIAAQNIANNNQRAQAVLQAASGLGGAAGSLGDTVQDEWFIKRKKEG